MTIDDDETIEEEIQMLDNPYAGDDSSFDPLKSDRIDPLEQQYIRFLQQNHIGNIGFWRFTTQTAPNKSETYPKTTTACCYRCLRPIKGIPFFPPMDYDAKKKCWVIYNFPLHRRVCPLGFAVEHLGILKIRQVLCFVSIVNISMVS